MKNRLFLICSASRVERFVRDKYGDSAYFLTALGAVFKLKEQAYIKELIRFIERETIEELIIVNDTSCCFIQSIVAKQKGYGTYAEQVLLDLFLDHYTYVTGSASEAEQRVRLAELNLQRQLEELLEIDYFLQQEMLQKLRLTGLVTSMAEDRAREVNLWLTVLSV